MRIDGTCHCGAIAFEAEADPATASICHCTDCQAMTGTAFRANIRVEAPNGTPVYATAPGDNPPVYTVRIGTLRQRDQLTPKVQNWFTSARPWVTELGALPRKPKG